MGDYDGEMKRKSDKVTKSMKFKRIKSRIADLYSVDIQIIDKFIGKSDQRIL